MFAAAWGWSKKGFCIYDINREVYSMEGLSNVFDRYSSWFIKCAR